MRKLIFILVATFFVTTLFGQTNTTYYSKNQGVNNSVPSYYFKTGATTNYIKVVTSIPYYNTHRILTTQDSISGSTIYTLLLPDTVQVATPTYTLPATASGKTFSFTDSFCLITVPTNATSAIPVGATINFFSYAGIMQFTPEAGAILESELDSVATGHAYAPAALRKIATNKFILYGSIKD